MVEWDIGGSEVKSPNETDGSEATNASSFSCSSNDGVAIPLPHLLVCKPSQVDSDDGCAWKVQQLVLV